MPGHPGGRASNQPREVDELFDDANSQLPGCTPPLHKSPKRGSVMSSYCLVRGWSCGELFVMLLIHSFIHSSGSQPMDRGQ